MKYNNLLIKCPTVEEIKYCINVVRQSGCLGADSWFKNEGITDEYINKYSAANPFTVRLQYENDQLIDYGYCDFKWYIAQDDGDYNHYKIVRCNEYFADLQGLPFAVTGPLNLCKAFAAEIKLKFMSGTTLHGVDVGWDDHDHENYPWIILTEGTIRTVLSGNMTACDDKFKKFNLPEQWNDAVSYAKNYLNNTKFEINDYNSGDSITLNYNSTTGSIYNINYGIDFTIKDLHNLFKWMQSYEDQCKLNNNIFTVQLGQYASIGNFKFSLKSLQTIYDKIN